MRFVRELGVGIASALVVNALVLFWASVLKPQIVRLEPEELLQRAVSEWHIWGTALVIAGQLLMIGFAVHAVVEGILDHKSALKGSQSAQRDRAEVDKELRDAILMGLGWILVAVVYTVAAIADLSP